jgi:hypothetical protein
MLKDGQKRGRRRGRKEFDKRSAIVFTYAVELTMNTTFKTNLCSVSRGRQMTIWHSVAWLGGIVGGSF